MTSNSLKLIDKFKKVNNLEIIESQSDIKRLSKDFYNYSPILTEKLEECIADLVVRPSDHNAVKAVAEICWEFSIPLTLRGSGTGNYGQAVPLFKGVVMQMSHFNMLEEFREVKNLEIIEGQYEIKRLSKDFYNYSPILTE